MTSPRTGVPYLDEVLTQPGAVLAFAHRGGALHPELPSMENTMPAFRHAVAQGYRYLETDVHATRDGVLLAFHDALLDRVTDLRGAIADLTYEEVARALIGGTEAVPTLESLFDAFPQARFNIDLKSREAVHCLADFLAGRSDHDRVMVGSFSARRLSTFRRLTEGRVPTSAHPLEVAAFRLLPSGRLADALTRGRVSALQVPHRRGRLVVVTAGFVRRAHAARKHVHVWTIDDPEEMDELLIKDVDGLITDRTDLLKEFLVQRGRWLDQGRNES